MKIGYARVSTKWYQSEFQISELKRQGCDKIWSETSHEDDDPDKSLLNFLDQIAAGDTVIATKMVSVARSSADFLSLLEQIQNKGAYFKSLAEPWANTNAENGQQIIDTIRGMIDFEISLACMKSHTDHTPPQTFGVSAGRPPKLNEQQKAKALSLLNIGKSAAEISRMLEVSRSTISRLKSAALRGKN